jgi:hypothetical protein
LRQPSTEHLGVSDIARKSLKQLTHLPVRFIIPIAKPVTKPAMSAASTAAKGLRSIVDSKSELTPLIRLCASAAPSESFCRAPSTAPKTVCRIRGLLAHEFGYRRSQFCNVVTQGRQIRGELVRSFLDSLDIMHVVLPEVKKLASNASTNVKALEPALSAAYLPNAATPMWFPRSSRPALWRQRHCLPVGGSPSPPRPSTSI